MKKNLLIIGMSGLTGYKIAKLSNKKFNVFGTYNIRPTEIEDCNSIKLDITQTLELSKIFSEVKPDYVINTSALHNVDYCEDNPNDSFKVNSESVKLLRDNCDKIGSRLVHISTDYVYDGLKTSPYKENEIATPVSVYGESKLAGEKSLENSGHVVLRPSVVYGWTPLELAGITSSSGKPMNFAMWLLIMLNKKQVLKIVTDQFATATLADSLAESAITIAESNSSGLFHVSGLSCESRFDFSKKFAKEFGYDENLIQSTDSSQFKQKAKRPQYSCLDCNKAIKELDLDLHTTESALKIMWGQVHKEAPHLLGK